MEYSHRACPFCSSHDAFSFNSDTGLFHCFSCGASPRKYGGLCYNGKDLSEFDLEDGLSLEPFYKDYRHIKSNIYESNGAYFTRTSEGDIVNFVYPNGTKIRKLWKDKNSAHLTTGKMDKFFGQDQYTSGKRITITEGEFDRLSVIQMLGDWPCVSVPGATPSSDFWINARDYLSKFESIYLSVDNDEPGDKLANKFYQIFPGKVYRVDHQHYKDANDFLVNGDSELYKKSYWSANLMKPDGILVNPEDFIKLYDETPDYEYFSTGIEGLDEKMLGIHKGAFTLILAETGTGKTEAMRYLEHQLLTKSDYKVAVCHLEESQLRSVLGLVSYDLDKNLTRKDLVEMSGMESQVKDSMSKLSTDNRFIQFDIRLEDSIDDLIERIRFLVLGMGADYIFIEPIQDIVSGNTTEKESLLTDLSNKLKRLAKEINVGIVVIAHANSDGDAKYCKSIVQSAAYEIRLSRDMESTDIAEANRLLVHVGRKNRTGGGSGFAGALLFDINTYKLTPELKPKEPDVRVQKDSYKEEIPF